MRVKQKFKSLFEIIDILGGGTPKTSIGEYWNGMIPWISVKDFNNGTKYVYETEKYITDKGLSNSSTQLLRKKDIIISARGTVGELAVIPFEMAFNQSCYGIRSKNEDNVDQDFLYYLLKYKVNELKQKTHGSVFNTITKDTFKNIKVCLPGREEQKLISNILSCLDEKIELNNKINANLEAQAQAIFKSWFVDFEPSQDGEFVESEIGLIPKGWRVESLTKIAHYLNGLAMQKFRPAANEKGIPVMKIKELRQGSYDSSSEYCSENIKKEYIVNDGDVIFSWSGSLLVDIWCGGTCGLNQHLFKVTSEKFDKWFYYFWTKYYLNKFVSIAAGKATTMGHIKRCDLEEALVIIPDKRIYKEASKLLSPMIEKVIVNRIQSRVLATFRDVLLPKLISCEIEVPVCEIKGHEGS